MKKNIKSSFRLKSLGFFLISYFVLAISSCNKDFENTLSKSFKNDTLGLGSGSRKVLYIVMDGVKGNVIKTLAPQNINSMIAHATYTYDGLADNNRNPITNAASWTNMITGVNYQQHQVVSEDFAGFNSAVTPTVFAHLNETLIKHITASYASSPAFNEYLAGDATIKETFNDDDLAVKNAVVKNLQEQNADLVVAQFHGAELAGIAGGYTTTNATYVDQINTLDGYIGEMLSALTNRSSYSGENWLVIVASNKGGGTTSGGAPGSDIYLDDSRNTFVAFYNPKFPSTSIDKPDNSKLPYSGIGPNFTGNSTNFVNAKLGNTTTGEFGTSGEYTIMMKIRVDNADAGSAPFLGKQLAVSGSTPGWVCNLSTTSGWVFRINTNSSSGLSRSQQNIRDGIWHTIAVRIYNNSGRKVRTYTDGKLGDEGPLGSTNFSSPEPLTLGYIPYGDNKPINLIIKDLAIYNVAIPEAELIPYMRKTVRMPADPYFANLIGWWPCDEGAGPTIKDFSGKSADFTFTGTSNWKSYSDISSNISPEISDAAFSVVPNGIDIPYAIYNWMNIPIPANWNLHGQVYLPSKSYPTN